MSDARIELTRELFHNWRRNGALPPDDLFDPDFELHTPLSEERGTPYRGPGAMHEWVHDLNEHLQGFTFEAHELSLHGDRVLALGLLEHEGNGTAAGLATEAGCVVDVVDGRYRRLELFTDPQAARDAVSPS